MEGALGGKGRAAPGDPALCAFGSWLETRPDVRQHIVAQRALRAESPTKTHQPWSIPGLRVQIDAPTPLRSPGYHVNPPGPRPGSSRKQALDSDSSCCRSTPRRKQVASQATPRARSDRAGGEPGCNSRRLLARGRRSGSTPELIARRAAWSGDVHRIHALFASRGPGLLESADPVDGSTPAHWAAAAGRAGVLALLHELAPGALDTRDALGQSPFHWAAIHGKAQCIQVLCDAGLSDRWRQQDFQGRTPLHWAAINGHDAVVNLLSKGGLGPQQQELLALPDQRGVSAQDMLKGEQSLSSDAQQLIATSRNRARVHAKTNAAMVDTQNLAEQCREAWRRKNTPQRGCSTAQLPGPHTKQTPSKAKPSASGISDDSCPEESTLQLGLALDLDLPKTESALATLRTEFIRELATALGVDPSQIEIDEKDLRASLFGE